MKAVISRTGGVSGMTTPATRPAAVVDMGNSWTQRLIGLGAPSFGSGHGDTSGAAAVPLWTRPTFVPLRAGPWCDHGLRSFVIVTATIGDVATAAMQPTYLLAAICRGDWVGWTRPGHGKPRCLVQYDLYDLSTPSSNALFVIGGGASMNSRRAGVRRRW